MWPGGRAIARAVFCVLALTGQGCLIDWDAYTLRSGGVGGAGGQEPGSSSSRVSSSTGGGMGGDGSGGGMGGGSAGGVATYLAEIAACLNPNAAMPDPQACTDEFGGLRMIVDINVMGTGGPRCAYLRFDLDGAFDGKIVDSVTLRLTVATEFLSEANQTGVVWQVEPFDEASLYVTAPATVGGSPLAPDQGAVALGETVLFDLPTDVVKPGSSVFLGIVASTDDAVFYWNLKGSAPPELIVSYH